MVSRRNGRGVLAAFAVILEHEHYGGSKQRGAWGDGSLLARSVEEYHAAYMSIHWRPRIELEENRAVIERINRRLGYRLQCRQISWPTAVTIGKPFEPGTYTVFVSVGQRDGTPRIGLPLDQDDGQHRYRLGSIRLEP